MWEGLFTAILKWIPGFLKRKEEKKRKLDEVKILFIDDEHEDFDIIKTIRDNREF